MYIVTVLQHSMCQNIYTYIYTSIAFTAYSQPTSQPTEKTPCEGKKAAEREWEREPSKLTISFRIYTYDVYTCGWWMVLSCAYSICNAFRFYRHQVMPSCCFFFVRFVSVLSILAAIYYAKIYIHLYIKIHNIVRFSVIIVVVFGAKCKLLVGKHAHITRLYTCL